MVRRTRPGISRFRVRCFASPRNDGWRISLCAHHRTTAGRSPRPSTPNRLCYPTGKSRMVSVESFAQKYSASRFPQITPTTPPSRPKRGAYPDRQKRGAGCGGRGSVGVNGNCRAGFACERSPSCRRTALCSAEPFGKDGHVRRSLLAKPDCCVRQNRVGLASVADVKLAEICWTRPGFDGSLIRQRR
jgi:hypothetical protein